MPRARIGCSGWQYAHWRDIFYPHGLPQRDWFAFYARHFDCVEINNTFYRLPPAATFLRWRDAAPDDFLYAVKYNRYASHYKRLMDPADAMARFMERSRGLGERLGPILVQLPPHWKADPPRLDAFLAAAPRDCRWAIEFRDPSWLEREVFQVLRSHGAALCLHDMIPDHPEEATAGWVYLRFHGAGPTGSYSAAQLAATARRIEGFLGDGLDVYAFFNNDRHGHALTNARELRQLLGQ